MVLNWSESLVGISASEWAAISSGLSLYAAYPWLRSQERRPDFNARYLVARDDSGSMLGALPTYLMRSAHGYGMYNPFELFARPALREAGEIEKWLPTAFGGSRSGYHNEIIVDRTLDDDDRVGVVRTLLSGFWHYARSASAGSLAFMYLSRAALQVLKPLIDADALVFFSGAETYLEVRWTSFDDYVASLASSRRRHLRREMDTFAKRGCAVNITRLSRCCDQIGPLLANVQQKYGHRASPKEMTSQLLMQAEELDPYSHVLLCHRGGQLIGFSLLYEWSGQLYVRALGFDYAMSLDSAVYFNLAFYGPIQLAIANKLGSVSFGLESYEAKFRRGAQGVSRWSLVVPPSMDRRTRDRLVEWNRSQYREWLERFGKYKHVDIEPDALTEA